MGAYDDIIDLSHHRSSTHPHMPLADRAAQFSPFAALTGHDAAIRETERLTDQRIELDETAKVILDEKLRLLLEEDTGNAEVSITYFRPDAKKNGGAYVTAIGKIKRMDNIEHTILLTNGQAIPIDDVVEIDSPMLDGVIGTEH
jgi:hypothetical protein